MLVLWMPRIWWAMMPAIILLTMLILRWRVTVIAARGALVLVAGRLAPSPVLVGVRIVTTAAMTVWCSGLANSLDGRGRRATGRAHTLPLLLLLLVG